MASKLSFVAMRPSWFGIFVYRLGTSSVTSIQFGGSVPSDLSMYRKSEVSLMYDFMFFTFGCKKWSMNCEMRSVGQPLPETIGLPGGFVFFLWIFGSM